MAIQPSTAHLRGGDSQSFTCDSKPVTWAISPNIGELRDAKGDSCVYSSPAKHRVWFSQQIVLTAVDSDGQPAGSSLITLDSSPLWIGVLTAFYIALFFGLVIGVVVIWPPAPATPWVEVSPPTVTIAPGLTQQFDASVWHEDNQGVTWTATDGLITPTGLFTAPITSTPASGRVVITATSNADKDLTRSALALINSPGLAVEPNVVSLGPSESKSFKILQTAQSGAPASSQAAGAAAPALDWLASDGSLKIHANSDGTTADVQAPPQFSGRKRAILTVRDKSNPLRQASAVIYLSQEQAPLMENLSEDELVRDKGLLLLVMLMGGLGALLGASRSLGNFVGNNAFVPRWTLFYILRPTFGAGLALLVFFGYRIGAISAVKGAAPADPFTAAFVAGMVGLFADTVLQKLKDVITALFPSQDDRRDKVVAPAAAAPSIDSIESSAANKKMTVRGKHFVSGAKVRINGRERETTFASPGELSVVLDTADTGDVKVIVTNPDKQESPEYPTKIGA